ncbi:MAG: DUF1801 domain-containing protein [Prolixibacteraceae bacterium]|nr:DUF1801 domain-containing protein [Prolixibacteraceae bacterium]
MEWVVILMKEKIPKIESLVQLYDFLPENERIITDVLRQIIRQTLPKDCREKISFNVPYFCGNKGICIIWPSAIPGGGIKKGVLLGFWYGNRLEDVDHYLTHGTNKQIFYKIYQTAEEIDELAIVKLLNEAVRVDRLSGKTKAGSPRS